jgi:hypothetical protein
LVKIELSAKPLSSQKYASDVSMLAYGLINDSLRIDSFFRSGLFTRQSQAATNLWQRLIDGIKTTKDAINATCLAVFENRSQA